MQYYALCHDNGVGDLSWVRLKNITKFVRCPTGHGITGGQLLDIDLPPDEGFVDYDLIPSIRPQLFNRTEVDFLYSGEPLEMMDIYDWLKYRHYMG